MIRVPQSCENVLVRGCKPSWVAGPTKGRVDSSRTKPHYIYLAVLSASDSIRYEKWGGVGGGGGGGAGGVSSVR